MFSATADFWFKLKQFHDRSNSSKKALLNWCSRYYACWPCEITIWLFSTCYKHTLITVWQRKVLCKKTYIYIYIYAYISVKFRFHPVDWFGATTANNCWHISSKLYFFFDRSGSYQVKFSSHFALMSRCGLLCPLLFPLSSFDFFLAVCERGRNFFNFSLIIFFSLSSLFTVGEHKLLLLFVVLSNFEILRRNKMCDMGRSEGYF